MGTSELDYFEKKYDKLLSSIPSVTIAVRVKPYIKIMVEEEAKKNGMRISQYLNKIILNDLMSPTENETNNFDFDKANRKSKSYKNQNKELQNDQDLELKLPNEKNNMFSIEGLDSRDLIMKLGIRIEQLKKITSEIDQKMTKQIKLLEAIRKAEMHAKRIQEMTNKKDESSS